MGARHGRAAVVVGVVGAVALSGCSGDADRTEITFFQFKPEAVQFFEQVVADFEAANPDVDVVLQNVPDAETALRTRLVKDDVPDVLTLNGNGTFGELASAGIFADFADDPLLAEVTPGYVDILAELGASSDGAVNGLPFAANASGVLYNVELFEEHGVEVPRTWTELVELAEYFEGEGLTPFAGMLADAWTAAAPMAPLTAQSAPEDFFEQRFADRTTFAEGWREPMEQLGTLFEYTQPGVGATGYEDGTRMFAQGESAMILIGSYAVPQIRGFEPDFTIGTFALPATDDPGRTTLVSGVDILVTTAAEPREPDAVRRLVEHLMQPEVVQEYAEAQVAIPALEGVTNDDPALAGVRDLIEADRLAGFTDHQFIPAIPLQPLMQQYLTDGDLDGFLTELDRSWDQVAQRRTWGLGAVQG